MAAGLPDLVDCARLAEDAAVLERVYELRELPRLQDVLAEPAGRLHASFAFSKTASGRAGARVEMRATPPLVCQRCMQGFAFPVTAAARWSSPTMRRPTPRIRSASSFGTRGGLVSLRELAEEELLLALPVAPACSTPANVRQGAEISPATRATPDGSDEMRRPFSALQDLLKKT